MKREGRKEGASLFCSSLERRKGEREGEKMAPRFLSSKPDRALKDGGGGEEGEFAASQDTSSEINSIMAGLTPC